MANDSKDFIIVVFDTVDGARSAYDSLADVRGGAYVHIEDSAVVYKDAEGNIKTDNAVSHGSKALTGAAGGIGLLAGVLLGGPIGGLAVGLLGGAAAGKLAKIGIDPKFVKQVQEELKPGTSALFLLSRPESRDLVVASMGPLRGTLYHTTLPPEAEALLREYLK